MIENIKDWTKCPDCGAELYEGPSGGNSTNAKCANINCGHYFNIMFPFGFQRIVNNYEMPVRKRFVSGR